jgi:hypothetical protein
MEHSPLFGISLPIDRTDLRSSMAHALNDDLFNDYFDHVSTDRVIDTLLENSDFDWKAISTTYMEFVEHDTSDQMHSYGKVGIGVMALSKIYFNRETDHAILFFEFKSSHQFQRGDVVFLEKTWRGHWKVVGFRNIWIT